MAKKEVKLTTDELNKFQGLQQEYNQLKLQLGDTILQQNQLMEKIASIREAFKTQEGPLMEKYGKNATINLETGEVTHKPAEETPDLKISK
tara:strand:- start:12633 stop:12905 length:273 start_codon:yes stop_codon:yes gene_type:complete